MNLEFEKNEVVEWIKQTFIDANKETAVIGLSGGIDSALIACLCVDALGKNNVVGILMPIKSVPSDKFDALKLANNLDICAHEVRLTPTFKSFEKDLSYLPYKLNKFTLPNVKSRLRMMELYAIADMANGLVVGTTNLTEDFLGYFTKYGDGGVDIEPIIQFYKTEVYHLSQLFYNKVIPKNTILKFPSAGLFPGQRDEDELGMSYKEMDTAISQFYAGKYPTTEREIKVFEKVINIHKQTSHKRNAPAHYVRS